MTDQTPTPESVRALLDRHGLPEDVVDGALALHAQELAAVQRREAAVWGVDTAAGKHILGAADLIDPTRTVPAAVPVPPPADQTALRDRIADAIRDAACPGDCGNTEEECARERIQPFAWHHGRLAIVEGTPEQFADAVLADLPEQTDRAAALTDRERAMLSFALEMAQEEIYARSLEFTNEDKAALETLRRVAAEEQPTETEAHPPEHTWAAELRDPLADEWAPGTRYTARDRAVNHLTHARSLVPTWKDGTPTQRRLVRATTTYTVEAEHTPPAVGEQPETQETPNPRTVCTCGHTRGEHVTVSGRLLCDECDPNSTNNLVCRGFEAL